MDRKKIFFELMEKELVKEGFIYKAGINGFIKKEQQNEYIYKFEAWPYFAQILPHYEIFIHSVEDIKKKAWGKLYKKSWSIGNVKTYFISNPSDSTSWTDTVDHVHIAVKNEIDFYYSFVKEYYMKYSDIKFLNNELNLEPSESKRIAYNHIHTSFLAIIVAKLSNNPNLHDLISFYRPIIRKHNTSYMVEYELLEKYLLSCSKIN